MHTKKESYLVGLNDTQCDYPKNKNLVQLFEEEVDKNRKKIAIIHNELQITYGELNKRANQLAHFINKLKIKSGSCIAIYFERSLETVVSFLAVMKLGNAYIPIEIDAPPEMIKKILCDAQVPLILTTKNFADKAIALASPIKAHVVVIDEQANNIHKEKKTNLPHYPATHVAYILYTSGSTGHPKGVQISHRSIINLIFAMMKEINFTNMDALLAITPFTFDLSVPDIYLPLLTGGRCVLANATLRFNPNEIIHSIFKYQTTMMQATPATWQMLINMGWKNESKIKIISGGEGLSTWLADKLLATQSPLWNFYGPTETTVWSTCHKIISIDKNKALIPIGRPIANTQIYILNDQLQQLPVDMPGELYIGGDGVAVGYLNHAKLTSQSFIPNPFSSMPDSKLYKTGDLALLSPEGELHYVGRIDTQIKVRGYRIEAEAIENILMDYPDIKECVVLDKSPRKIHELVAYVVIKNTNISLKQVKKYLKDHFPSYMIPSLFIVIEKFPLTSNGKINRKLIPSLTDIRFLTDEVDNTTPTKNKYEEIIVDLIQTLIQSSDVDPESNFFDLGMHSIMLIELADALSRILSRNINAVDLFEHPTIRAFASYLLHTEHDHPINQEISSILKAASLDMPSKQQFEHDIAVIGMACKLPGADSPEAFWKAIIDKTESIQFFTEIELMNAGIPSALINDPDYIPARGILTDGDKFDAAFFGYSPYEANLMDPQHRVFLEQSWTALEDAGYVATSFPGRIGLFAGMNDSSYLLNQLLKNQKIQTNYDTQQITLATSTHYLSTKTSYAMGLTGPSVTINTACSTGLVSIAFACESLAHYRCDMALAGAINLVSPQQSGYLYRELGILSPNGHCHVFDEEAKGTVLSNGCGVIVLRRLSDALRDNDNILAVIKGWDVNNDGANKAGFTAPSISGQTDCIKRAITHAGIAPTEVEYVEAHGTGTLLGDPIEIAALAKGYAYDTYKKTQYCAIGSVKANIGHTDTAAGTAGFIKTVLALQNKILPPNINYTKENTKINFAETPYYVNCKTQPWKTKHKKRTAAVNSLGFGGTNAHMILQEAPEVKTTMPKHGNVLIISAKTPQSLKTTTAKLYQHILKVLESDHTEKLLADTAYTLQVGRAHFRHRTAIAYTGSEHLLQVLGGSQQTVIDVKPISKVKNRQIIFGFVGQGAQYAGMAADIYLENPFFKQTIDECCELLKEDIGLDLRELLFPEKLNIHQANKRLQKTQYAQPALFVIEYALSQLFITLGIKPTGMIGHSVGECVAATVSGVLNLKDALKLIATRANLMAKTPTGVMLAVPLSEEKTSEFLTRHVELAVHNAPRLCIVSGEKNHIDKFEKSLRPLLEQEGLACQNLRTSHAFHSKHMDEILDEFTNFTTHIELKDPMIPYISNVTGNWINRSDLNNKKYWADHIRKTVLFSDGIKHLNLSEDDIFIEIGPGQILSQLIRQHPNQAKSLLHTLPHYKNAQDNSYESFLNTVARLWLLNLDIRWSKLYTNEIRKRISLPTYSFERESHWIYPSSADDISTNKIFTKNTLYSPTWERDKKLSAMAQEPLIKDKCWIIFQNEPDTFITKLQSNQELFYIISSGLEFKKLNEFSFSIDPANKEHYVKLFQEIEVPYEHCTILHAWLTTPKANILDPEEILNNGPYCLMYLSQAFTEIYPSKLLKGLVLTNQIYSVLGNEIVSPVKAAILGPCKVIPQEQDNIFFKLIDLETELSPVLIDALYSEAETISSACFKEEIAYRGDYRWLRHLQPCSEVIEDNKNNRIKLNGVYLITGGLGGIGLALAQHLAKKYHVNLVLVSRSDTLPSSEWQDYIKNCENRNKNEDQKRFQQIISLIDINKNAASLTIKVSAVEDAISLNEVILAIKQKFGRIDGVIHAAGIAGGGVAQLKTVKEYQKVLQPKLKGTQNLIYLLKDEPLDFIVFVSSITAITGFPGQIDYCSANRVLDAYAVSSTNFKHPVFCVTMNWQAWREVGMAASSKTLLVSLDESNSTDPKEACLLFEKILNANLNQVIISNEDLNTYKKPKTDYNSTSHSSGPLIEKPFVNSSDVITALRELWCQTLGVSEVGLDDDFYELGGHSLLAISLLSKIRSKFSVKLSSTTLFEIRTIRALSTVIQSYTQENEVHSPLVILQRGDESKPPLFIVHPVGGTVFCYLPMVKELSDDRTVYAFQDPGVEHEKPYFISIEEMATCYRDIIQKIQPAGPYYLCGASFGASVTIEIAHQLLEDQKSVNFVGLIDGWGKFSKTKFDADYVKDIIHLHKQDPNQPDLSSNLESQALWEKLLNHRLKMMLQYKHKKLPIKLTLFKATELLPEYKSINTKDNHWSQYSSLPIDVFEVPGDHNTMLQDPNVQTLAEFLQDCLDKIPK